MLSSMPSVKVISSDSYIAFTFSSLKLERADDYALYKVVRLLLLFNKLDLLSNLKVEKWSDYYFFNAGFKTFSGICYGERSGERLFDDNPERYDYIQFASLSFV
jgi:hypothetical protein